MNAPRYVSSKIIIIVMWNNSDRRQRVLRRVRDGKPPLGTLLSG